MKAADLVLAARRRKGLTQRQLSKLTGIPQPMLSSIERGIQDPRHSTLERILGACGVEMDIVNIAGAGIDQTMFPATLAATPGERLRHGVRATHAIDRLARNARRVH